ncbi:MAG: SpoIIIAH-like family protein [Tissierellia bacterium]|nr:SpoIIIAH-like family protein [Tissierellia bacterium]MDD4780790.1 SpoIIIAH-like family protein [Tissierellia bacterium]
MIMKKETIVFLTSLAIIFIIGYVNLTMAPKNDEFNAEEYANVQNEISADAEILGDITDITDVADLSGTDEKDVPVMNTDVLNVSFANFKLNKEKSNMDLIDHLEENISNNLISSDTKQKFENLLLNKNNYIQTEQNLELMLQSKGYNESVVVVDENIVKVITNDTIEQADATQILHLIVSETNYEPSQIKIVKFDNIDL